MPDASKFIINGVEIDLKDMSARSAIDDLKTAQRITPLHDSALSVAQVVEALGIPVYVSDVSDYAAYGISETGWYVFARVTAKGSTKVTAQTTVQGAAGYIKTTGADHIDVAVRFGVTAESQVVTIDWGGYEDKLVFKASDLAVRNLDYRTTFYVYDISPFVTWTFGLTSDAAFAADKDYYTLSGTTYSKVTVTPNDAVPAYYTSSQGYVLTNDATFAEGKTYYTKSGDEYSEATVTVGEAVTANTYYEQGAVYTQATGTFQDGVTYYTKSGDTYSVAAVTTGEAIPAYYNHTKLTFSGMSRNITYKLDDIVDCPMEFILPEIEDETHGCWFEIRLQHAGSYSMTLVPPTGVKIATEHTQAETKGLNMIDLHYTSINGVKLWRFLNTHSSIPE